MSGRTETMSEVCNCSDGAMFRAARMQLGATLLDVAFALDVNVKSVKHWERNVNEIPDDAWMLLDSWEDEKEAAYNDIMAKAQDVDGAVMLPLFTNQKQYQTYSTETDTIRSYNRYNAATFMAAADLEAAGFAVGYYYPGEDD